MVLEHWSKNKKILLIAFGALLVLGAGYLAWSKSPTNQKSDSNPKNPDIVFCTQEARFCPDGSYVGRGGPNCEFAPCPGKKR